MADSPVDTALVERVKHLANEIHAELDPAYHVTPGGLKWSRSTDALRELAALASVPARSPDTLTEALEAIDRECDYPAEEHESYFTRKLDRIHAIADAALARSTGDGGEQG